MASQLLFSTARLVGKRLSGGLALTRGKAKQPKHVKKEKKLDNRTLMKLEVVRKYREAYIMGVAKFGEPMDPEFLNPIRKRKIKVETLEEKTRNTLLLKEWARHLMQQQKKDQVFLRGMVASRNKALKELKKVSVPLYERSLDIVTDLLPFERMGPTYSPPDPNYTPPEEEEKMKK